MSTWTPKPGCPTTQARTYNSGKYAGIGPRLHAEITAADNVLYWALFIDDQPRHRGGLESRCLARGTYADIPPARSALKGRITRLAMTHLRAALDRTIAAAIETLAVTVAEHEGIAKAAADLDLADHYAVVTWDRDKTRAAEAEAEAAARLNRFLALTNA